MSAPPKGPAKSPIVEVLPDPEALAERAAHWLLENARAKSGLFAVSLSGGSTPRRLYQLLASPPLRDRFPWARTHWFWGDERFVPHDDPASNYRMTREAMLARAPVPPENVHPMPTEHVSAAHAAEAYERELKSFYGRDTLDPERPLFDVELLGLGTNGHTASLFPGMAVLQDRAHWVGTMTDKQAGTRLTLTYPALESAREVAFLVAGKDKQPVLTEILSGKSDLPAAHVHPRGTLRYFVDRAAAPIQ
ncbi:MAG: 6-phosphogluconolactonase [Alphaproteobacteria bacterium]|nr:6-phosphogluconolactonase [Alphaproteobacteria bacterium]